MARRKKGSKRARRKGKRVAAARRAHGLKPIKIRYEPYSKRQDLKRKLERLKSITESRRSLFEAPLRKVKKRFIKHGFRGLDPRGYLRTRVKREVARETPIEDFHHAAWRINPRRIVVCTKRAARREVLFALKRAGRGKGGPKDKRYTEDSRVRC